MKKSEFVEMLAYAENERDLLFLENTKLKARIAALEKRISDMEASGRADSGKDIK